MKRVVACIVPVAALVAASCGFAQAPKLELTRDGMKSLTFAGQEFIERPSLHLTRLIVSDWSGIARDGDQREARRTLDSAGNRVTMAFAWGEVTCGFRQEADRLKITLDVANTGDAIIDEIGMELAAMKFPSTPAGWVEHRPYRGFNVGWPTINLSDCGSVVLAACNEDVNRPLMFGWAGRQSTTQRPLVLATASDWLQELLNPMMRRPIYPGGREKFEVSIRFGKSGSTWEQMGADLIKRFQTGHPCRLKWDDRRPIGAVHLSTSELKAPKNPRGWLMDRAADFSSEAGRKELRERILKRARDSVEALKSIDAQGMITWDIEGQEYPHAISYIGDPRSLPPEIDAIADEYFKIFTVADLRTGLTLRPQLPMRTAYGQDVNQIEPADPFAVLDAKLAYAKKRWGCTLFYVDSNGDPNAPLPAAVFSRLAAKHPDVLLIPEHETAEYYAYTAPYRHFPMNEFGAPAEVRAIYPKAFAVVAVAHADPTPAKARFVEEVRRGNILLINAWFKWPGLDVVKDIYREAKK